MESLYWGTWIYLEDISFTSLSILQQETKPSAFLDLLLLRGEEKQFGEMGSRFWCRVYPTSCRSQVCETEKYRFSNCFLKFVL